MNYVIFDLEWNRFTKAVKIRCADEIIQIGAVKYNDKMEYMGYFTRYINPVIIKKWNRLFKSLQVLTYLF